MSDARPDDVRAASTPDMPRSKFILAFMLGALAIGMVGVVALAVGVTALDGDGSGGASGEGGASTTLDLITAEFSIGGEVMAPAGDVTLRITNEGTMIHNVGVRELGLISEDVAAGEVTELALGELEPGTYELYCAIAGHEAAGMVATLTITEGGDSGGGSGEATEAASDSTDHSSHSNLTEEEYEAMDMAMTESMLAFPAETEGRGNPILEPTEILEDGTKVFDLTAEIVDWEVAPGEIVEAWTYNGVVPAPQFVLDRGDKIQVRVVNNLPMGTDIHWHGVHTPNDQDGVAPYTQDLIEPNGGTFTYEFVAEDDAIGMYHAHNHGQMQVVNGMFGAFRIGDNPIPYGETISGVTLPDQIDLAVDMPMVINDAGTVGLTLNGKSFPATDPLILDQGEWASITYYNEGLQTHPMHLHQFPQLVYAKDGIPLDQPYWVDTLNVSPGERYTVLFRADDVGTWVWHCHILTHVERETGMFGMVTAIVVNENPAFDPTAVPVEPVNWRNTAGSPIGVDRSDDLTGAEHGAGGAAEPAATEEEEGTDSEAEDESSG